MGGRISAQLTGIMFLMADLDCRISQLCVGFTFFRFRDNLPDIFDPSRISLAEIQALFIRVYGMPCKIEQSGDTLISLEMRIFMHAGNLRWCHKSRLANVWDPELPTPNDRVPARWSSNRRLYLHTVLPSALSKCVLYGSSHDMVCTAI